MQKDFHSSAWLDFQNFLLFLLCTSWFSLLLCCIQNPCGGIFYMNLRSYQKSIINSLVRILFNKISRKKQAEQLFLEKGINSIFITLVYYLLIVVAEGVFLYPNSLWYAFCTDIIISFPSVRWERFFLWDYNDPHETTRCRLTRGATKTRRIILLIWVFINIAQLV